jgi:hypothetical protein
MVVLLLIGYASMAELMVEWADLVDMPLATLLGQAGATAGSGGSLSRAYSTGASSNRNLLQSSASAAAGGAGGSGSASSAQDGAHLDVLLLQVGTRGTKIVKLCGVSV